MQHMSERLSDNSSKSKYTLQGRGWDFLKDVEISSEHKISLEGWDTLERHIVTNPGQTLKKIEEAFRNGNEVELMSEVEGKNFTTTVVFTQISRHSSPFKDGHAIVQALGAIVSPTNTDSDVSVEFNLDEHNTPTCGSFMRTTKMPED